MRALGSLHRQLNQEKHINPLATPSSNTAPADEDLADPAVPGHGIPSQETDPAAQFALKPHEAERETNSVLMGGAACAPGPNQAASADPLSVSAPLFRPIRRVAAT